MAVICTTLEEVRTNIDRLDQQIVTLLAERGRYVSQAAHFKKDADGVKAPQRVEQVIAKVRNLAQAAGANPQVTEQVYRAMIAAFIQQELADHAALTTQRAACPPEVS
ncbi:chorismate mutase [Pseudomonas lurida]|uniref:chorismate mutase n=1 Tax=Pseudomonas TaxID=286 RepID=UPI0015E46103|nr:MULTISPECIES: chorismate mutase [Pseudomonas]MBA1294786.1 chorismate mutase [Pseudomonas lurida]